MFLCTWMWTNWIFRKLKNLSDKSRPNSQVLVEKLNNSLYEERERDDDKKFLWRFSSLFLPLSPSLPLSPFLPPFLSLSDWKVRKYSAERGGGWGEMPTGRVCLSMCGRECLRRQTERESVCVCKRNRNVGQKKKNCHQHQRQQRWSQTTYSP